jgi:LMBR1-like membrane protein
MKLPYDMDFIWTAINFSICFVLMFFLPMALALYNDESEDWQQTVKYAIKVSAIIALGHIAFVSLYYIIVSTAQLPVKHVAKRMVDVIPSSGRVVSQTALDFYLPTSVMSNWISIKLGFFNCCTLHLTVIGSLLLILLGGYGLASFPMEFLNAFLNRPQIRDPEDFVLTKVILRLENEKLVNHAKKVKQDKEDLEKRTVGFIAQRARKMALQKEINELKNEFLEFEEVMECFKQEQNIQDVNPLVHISYLVFGCIGYLASFLIVFHT